MTDDPQVEAELFDSTQPTSQRPSIIPGDCHGVQALSVTTELLRRGIPFDLFFGAIAAIAVALVFWHAAAPTVLFAWLGAQVVASVARLADWAANDRLCVAAHADPRRRLARYQRGVMLCGMTWGAGALLPIGALSANTITFLFVATAAVTLSACAAAANSPRISLGFAMPALLPVSSLLAWRGSPADLALGGLVWLLIVRLALGARNGGLAEDIATTASEWGLTAQRNARDPLTGLPTRREFEERIAIALESAHRDGIGHALCYLDLDRFEIVNDTCGHDAGDALLKELATRLRARLRQGDTLARLGGDEFGVLLERCPPQHARRIAELLRKVVDEFRFTWQDKTFHLGASVGLVPIDRTIGSLSEVLSAADSACYVAKDQGRNRIHVFQWDDQAVAERHGQMQWLQRIQDALDNDRFELYFQPIVQLRRGEPAGIHGEVLLRMRTASGETVPPGAFLPAAERYHLMPAIDRWVVSHAFAALARHRRDGSDVAICAINLSGQSLSDPAFLDFIVGQMERHQTRSTQLCFEITETAVIANLANATRFMKVLRNMGCRFALDDFGSGLSSFAYLKNLSVDYLKLDGSFVKNMVCDNIDRAMVKAINQLGHVMSIETIAEFVENDATLKAARVMGIDHAQGYGVGMPEPIDAVLPKLGGLIGKPSGKINSLTAAMPGSSRS